VFFFFFFSGNPLRREGAFALFLTLFLSSDFVRYLNLIAWTTYAPLPFKLSPPLKNIRGVFTFFFEEGPFLGRIFLDSLAFSRLLSPPHFPHHLFLCLFLLPPQFSHSTSLSCHPSRPGSFCFFWVKSSSRYAEACRYDGCL